MSTNLRDEFIEKAPKKIEELIDELTTLQKNRSLNNSDFNHPIRNLKNLLDELRDCQHEASEQMVPLQQKSRNILADITTSVKGDTDIRTNILKLEDRVRALEMRVFQPDTAPKPFSNKSSDMTSYPLETAATKQVHQDYRNSMHEEVKHINPSADIGPSVLHDVSASKPVVTPMQIFVNEYNSSSFRTKKLKLTDALAKKILQSGEAFNISESHEKIVLEETFGEGPYYFKAIENEANKFYVVPIKMANFSKERVNKDAYREVFKFNVDTFAESGSKKFTLKTPAIFEKNSQGQYELLKTGEIEIND